MIWTSGPAVVLAVVAFAILGLGPGARHGVRPAQPQAALANEFWISPINLLPMLLLVILSLRRMPPFLSIFGCALFAGVLAWFTQPQAVAAFVDRPDQNCDP